MSFGRISSASDYIPAPLSPQVQPAAEKESGGTLKFHVEEDRRLFQEIFANRSEGVDQPHIFSQKLDGMGNVRLHGEDVSRA